MNSYSSKIEDLEIIQGDSSPIYFMGLPDNSSLDGGDWVARYTIISSFGESPLVSRSLPLNSGTGHGDIYVVGTKFVFQITPNECSILQSDEKYIVSVEIKNDTIPYNGEIAQFRLKVKPQGVI